VGALLTVARRQIESRSALRTPIGHLTDVRRAGILELCGFKMARDKQLALDLPTWGGRRDGAGRRPAGERSGVSHARRPRLSRHHPVHVTWRMLPHVWNLRSRRAFRRIAAAFAAGCDRDGFRLIRARAPARRGGLCGGARRVQLRNSVAGGSAAGRRTPDLVAANRLAARRSSAASRGDSACGGFRWHPGGVRQRPPCPLHHPLLPPGWCGLLETSIVSSVGRPSCPDQGQRSDCVRGRRVQKQEGSDPNLGRGLHHAQAVSAVRRRRELRPQLLLQQGPEPRVPGEPRRRSRSWRTGTCCS